MTALCEFCPETAEGVCPVCLTHDLPVEWEPNGPGREEDEAA